MSGGGGRSKADNGTWLFLIFGFRAEFVGGGARFVRRADVHRQGDHEDNAEGPEVVKVREGGRAAGGRGVRQHQVLEAVRFELAEAHENQ